MKVLFRILVEDVPVLCIRIANEVRSFRVVLMFKWVFASQRAMRACRQVRVVTAKNKAIFSDLYRRIRINVRLRMVVGRIDHFTRIRIIFLRLVFLGSAFNYDVNVERMDLRLFTTIRGECKISNYCAVLGRVVNIVVVFRYLVLSPAIFNFEIRNMVILRFKRAGNIICDRVEERDSFLGANFTFLYNGWSRAINDL